jgi:hypothetical protein
MKSYSIFPEMGHQEAAIYRKIFELDFYTKQARNTLRGIAGSEGGDWTSLREGDSSITRLNKNEVAKSFNSLANSTREELMKMSQYYLKFNSVPQQVVGDDYIPGSYYRGISPDYDNYRVDKSYLL